MESDKKMAEPKTKNPKPVTANRKPVTVHRKRIQPQGERILDPAKTTQYWEKLTRLVARTGPTNSNLSFSAKAIQRAVSAGIDPMSWDIKINIQTNLRFRADKKLDRFLRKMNISDPFLRLVEDCCVHEIGHWEFPRGSQVGCPYDNYYYHESFLTPAYEELSSCGKFSESFCKQWAQRAANAVADIIDNYNVFRYSKNGSAGSGQILFWYLAGQDGGFQKEYTLFVKTNLALFGNKEAVKLLEQFNSTEEEKSIGESVSKLKKVFTTESMMNRDEWEELTRTYVKELVKYIEEEDQPECPMSAGDETSTDNGDQQENGQPKQGGSQESKGDEEDESQDSNEGSQELKSPFGKLTDDDKEKIMQDKADKGKGIPFYLDRDDALDSLYKSLSRRIRLKTKKGDQPTTGYPLVPIRRRAFDRSRDDVLSADTGRLYYDPVSRRMRPSVVTHRHSVNVPIRKDFSDFPGVAFALFDASGTMMGDGDCSTIPWGDESGYHFGVLAFYGLLKQLERMKLLRKVDFSASIFHSETISAEGLKDCKKLLLNPTSGGTYIDMDEVKRMLKGKKNALFPLISDGDIHNWDEVKDDFIALAKSHQFFMIKVFGENQTTRDLRAAGLKVEVINHYEDLVDLVVDLTARTYEKALKAKFEKESKKYQRR
jgi:hypothetical protein